MADAVNENQRHALFVSRSVKPVAATAGPVVLFTAGGARFAVEASQVEEIRDRDERGAIHRLRGPELAILWSLRIYLIFMMTVVAYQVWLAAR